MLGNLKLVVLTTIICVTQIARFVETVKEQHDARSDLTLHKADTSDTNRRILTDWHAEAPFNHPDEAMSDVLAELAHGPSIEKRLREASSREEQRVKGLPDKFDARQKWKKCKRLIGTIHNDGPCRSDYAIVTASVLADRFCIKSNGKLKTLLSAQKVLGCYGSCKDGGFLWSAFKYVNETGTTTGGLYKPKRGCIPFEPEPCLHVSNNGRATLGSDLSNPPNCSTIPQTDYNCSTKCTNPRYKKNYEKDLHKTENYKWTSTNAEKIQEEIYQFGSVAAGFSMYDDFRRYKSGVYRRNSSSRYEYIHKVKLIGWGIENGTAYWLGVNSFGKEWGVKGLFWFPRAENYLFIETLVISVDPEL